MSLSGPKESDGRSNMPPPRPVAAPPLVSALPAELCALPQWVMWAYRLNSQKTRWTKEPLQTDGTSASTSDSMTWTTFAQAAAAYDRTKFDGIGFVTTDRDPYLLIDLDHAVDSATGEIAGWAAAIIAKAKAEGAYIESSPSGTGFHIIGRGEQMAKGKKRNDAELYSWGRFFTMTGGAL
jgi:primase-polymerase (primpol)-like protein